MPISGLSKRGEAFPVIGKIFKGAPKNDKGFAGRDLTYFRVEIDASRPDLKDKFLKAYGLTPTQLHVVFPFNDRNLVDTNYECYNSGRRVAAAGVIPGMLADQDYYMVKLHHKSGQVLAKNGYWVEGDMAGQPALFDPTVPEYQYKNRKGEVIQVYAKPTTRVRLVIWEFGEYAEVTLRTTSFYDALFLGQECEAIWQLTGGRWAGIPMVLDRRTSSVTCKDDAGARTLRELSLLHIEIDPQYAAAKLEATYRYQMAALTANIEANVPILPASMAAQLDAEVDEKGRPIRQAPEEDPDAPVNEDPIEGEWSAEQGEEATALAGHVVMEEGIDDAWQRWAELAEQADHLGLEYQMIEMGMSLSDMNVKIEAVEKLIEDKIAQLADEAKPVPPMAPPVRPDASNSAKFWPQINDLIQLKKWDQGKARRAATHAYIKAREWQGAYNTMADLAEGDDSLDQFLGS